MIVISIKFPGGLVVPTPEGDVVFPAGEWVPFKPKWTLWPELVGLVNGAKAMGVQILDQNEDVLDLAGMSDENAVLTAKRTLAYLARFR